MSVVRGGEVAGARSKAAGDAFGALAPFRIAGRRRIRQQGIDAAADEVGHRPAPSGRELSEAPSLHLGELNLRAHHYIT